MSLLLAIVPKYIISRIVIWWLSSGFDIRTEFWRQSIVLWIGLPIEFPSNKRYLWSCFRSKMFFIPLFTFILNSSSAITLITLFRYRIFSRFNIYSHTPSYIGFKPIRKVDSLCFKVYPLSLSVDLGFSTDQKWSITRQMTFKWQVYTITVSSPCLTWIDLIFSS